MSSKNHTHIHSLKGLQAEKAALRLRITAHELDFQQRLKKLPVEVIKASLGKIIPFFLGNKAASSAWLVVRGIFGLFSKRKPVKTGTRKNGFLYSLKEWGLTALVRALLGLFSK